MYTPVGKMRSTWDWFISWLPQNDFGMIWNLLYVSALSSNCWFFNLFPANLGCRANKDSI